MKYLVYRAQIHNSIIKPQEFKRAIKTCVAVTLQQQSANTFKQAIRELGSDGHRKLNSALAL
jgi:hypothetical protein